ncbi:MAG: helix-turn-helix domain-containing protein [Candidatus Micrarchaeaceae archaeon]
MKTAYKYRAYPSKEQKAKLDRQMLLAKIPAILLKNQKHITKTRKTLQNIE